MTIRFPLVRNVRSARRAAKWHTLSSIFMGVVIHISTRRILATVHQKERLNQQTIRIIGAEHVARRPKNMHPDLIPWPFLVKNAFQFLHQLGPPFVALSCRQYPIVQLPHVPTQFAFLCRVQILLRHRARPLERLPTDRVWDPPPRMRHACFKFATCDERPSGLRAR